MMSFPLGTVKKLSSVKALGLLASLNQIWLSPANTMLFCNEVIATVDEISLAFK